MTEARMDTRGYMPSSQNTNNGASVLSTASSTKTAPSSSKLRASAKEFVFSAAAPVWTPGQSFVPKSVATVVAAPIPAPSAPSAPAQLPAPIAVEATPVPVSSPAPVSIPAPAPVAAPASTKKSLNFSAKAFVPSFMAAPFVPASIQTSAPKPAPIDTSITSPTKNAMSPVTPASTMTPMSATSSEPEAESPVHQVTEEPVVEEQTPPASPVKEQQKEEEEEDDIAQVQAIQKTIGERIIYTISQLLDMQPELTPMPESVVSLPIACANAHKQIAAGSSSSSSSSGAMTPTNGRPPISSKRGHGGRSGGPNGGGRRGAHGGGRRGAHGGGPILDANGQEYAPLEINDETRWKPSHARSRLDGRPPMNDEDTEKSLKEAKSILNKLSIEKFDKLSDQLIQVAVKHMDVLSGVIEQVIQKAQMEWHFSSMYANLCCKIASTEMPAIQLTTTTNQQQKQQEEEEDNNNNNEQQQQQQVVDTHKLFRKLLLSRCQKEFESTKSLEEQYPAFELDNFTEEERQEKEMLFKRATLGHIRFIGELFKQRMLSSRIMHACIQRLFGDVHQQHNDQQVDEEKMECLCKLLCTIGQFLEMNARDGQEKQLILQYYTLLDQMANPTSSQHNNKECTSINKLSTRLRFMFQDLLELRQNNWITRRKETKAMTIAEIHAEAAKEAKAKQKSLHRSQSMMMTNVSSSTTPKNHFTTPMSSSRRSNTNTNRGSGNSNSNHNKNNNTNDDGWETVGSCSSNQNASRPRLVKSKSAILPNGRSSKEQSGRFVASNNGRHNRKSSSPPKKSHSSKIQEERPQEEEENTKKTVEEQVEVLTEQLFEKKIKSILDEFIEMRNMDDAVHYVTQLNSSVHHGLIPIQTINFGLEKNAMTREGIGALLSGLYEHQVLTSVHLTDGLKDILEFAEDLEIDIPHTLQYVSEMIAPSVSKGALTFENLVSTMDHLRYNGKASVLMANIVKHVKETKSQEDVINFVQGQQLMDLLKEEERHEDGLKSFLQTHELEFLLL